MAASELAAHLKVCNVARRALEEASTAYLRPGVNGGEDSDEEDGIAAEAAAAKLWRVREEEADFPAARDAVRCARCAAASGAACTWLTTTHPSAVADAVLAAVATCDALPGPVPRPQCVANALAAAAAAAAAPHAVVPFCARHAEQQAGILAYMAHAALLPPTDEVVFAELGAGRGYLSHLLAEAYGACVFSCMRCVHVAALTWLLLLRPGAGALLLVERRAYRNKAERQLRRLSRVTVARLRCDVEGLDLCAAPLPPPPPPADAATGAVTPPLRRRLVVTAKHLCGGGTDSALRCAARCSAICAAAPPDSPALLGIAMAPCCHHACRWRSFCGKAALRDAGLGPLQFALAARMASWAIDASAAALHAGGAAPEAAAAASAASAQDDRFGVGPAERVAVGVAVKRLFDGARAAWASAHCGGDAALVRYCEHEASPENRLIVMKCNA